MGGCGSWIRERGGDRVIWKVELGEGVKRGQPR